MVLAGSLRRLHCLVNTGLTKTLIKTQNTLKHTDMRESISLELYTQLRNQLEPILDEASSKVQSFPTNEIGLLIRTDESIKAKREYDILFKKLRTLNGMASNAIKKQYHLNKNGGSIYKFKKK